MQEEKRCIYYIKTIVYIDGIIINNQVPERAPTSNNIIIGLLIDLMFFDIVLNIKSTCILFLSPTKNTIAAPISKIN